LARGSRERATADRDGIDHYLPPNLQPPAPALADATPFHSDLSGACTVFVIAMQAGENLRIGYQLCWT